MVICGDTFEVLKTLDSNSIDMGVTSPPYNKQENKKGWLVKNVIYSSSSDKKDESIYQYEQINVLNELYRVIKPGGSFFYNHKIRWEKGNLIHPISWILQTDWHLRQEIIWDRGIAANIRGWRFWQTEERIYWLYKPKNKQDKIGTELKSKHALCTSIWKIRPENNNSHPAPFPIAIPTRCIYSILDDNSGTIIDPYCGSGTTLVAAQLLGHQYIGIDISHEYIEQTKRRLAAADKEYEKVQEECSIHSIKETFEDRKKRGMYKHKLQNKPDNISVEDFI